MSTYNDLDDEGRRIVDAASAQLGVGAAPTRQTSERELHQFNQRLRQQPFVQQWR